MQQYKILERIGEGASGSVFLALSQSNRGQVKVAIKEIQVFITKDGLPSWLLRELTILSNLNHPNIIPLLDIIIQPSHILLVTPYQSNSLGSIIASQRSVGLSHSLTRWYILQILHGLHALHSSHIMHRDIKPANILINDNNHVYLCDLGLSRYYGVPLSLYTNSIVTLYYRSPELLLGCETYGTTVDLWSLGVVWIEALHGTNPFEISLLLNKSQGPTWTFNIHNLLDVLAPYNNNNIINADTRITTNSPSIPLYDNNTNSTNIDQDTTIININPNSPNTSIFEPEGHMNTNINNNINMSQSTGLLLSSSSLHRDNIANRDINIDDNNTNMKPNIMSNSDNIGININYNPSNYDIPPLPSLSSQDQEYINQINNIFSYVGTPNIELLRSYIPNKDKLYMLLYINQYNHVPIHQWGLSCHIDRNAAILIQLLLNPDHLHRINAEALLNDPYFADHN